MDLAPISFSRKEKITIIFAVTIGNLLEWYEIYLYIYWAPILSKLFFNSHSDVVNLANTFLVFAVGFLSRPFGGLFFGRLGDRIGRRKALILSLLMMTVPTFITGFLPTYAQIGWMAPALLGLMRIVQSFPAGGELPGAFCYLYESSRIQKRHFMSSWGAFGYQMGILISTVESFIMERSMSPEALSSWGWRFSFMFGGIIGLCGLFLRYRLHETPLYKEMQTHERVIKEPILGVLNKHKKGILIGFFFCALNSSMFYLMSINFSEYFAKTFNAGPSANLIITMLILVLVTAPLPFFGILADRYNNNKKMLIISTVGIVLLLYPLYLSISYSSLIFMSIIVIALGLFFTCLSALIPYILCDLFATRVRFTCVGISFNLVDALVGGFTPVAAMWLTHLTRDDGSFCWILLFFALCSLVSYAVMKEHPHHT